MAALLGGRERSHGGSGTEGSSFGAESTRGGERGMLGGAEGPGEEDSGQTSVRIYSNNSKDEVVLKG